MSNTPYFNGALFMGLWEDAFREARDNGDWETVLGVAPLALEEIRKYYGNSSSQGARDYHLKVISGFMEDIRLARVNIARENTQTNTMEEVH